MNLQQKYKQLNFQFDQDLIPSAPVIEDDLTNLKKLYIPIELLKYPFFFPKTSKIVNKSRKVYREIKKSGNTNPDKNITINLKDFTKDYTDDEIDKMVNRKITSQWLVESDIRYGLPDSFDGHVWDIIMQNISNIYRQTSNFYQYYFFSVNFIYKQLYKKGIIKSKKLSGQLSTQIKDALIRLNKTTYKQIKKGFYRKDKRDYISEYSLNLITAIYWKEQELPDGSYSKNIAIAIDPLTLINFLNRNYFISSNHIRQSLTQFEAIRMYDNLSYYSYINIDNGRFFYLKTASLKPFIPLNYSTLCTFLGYQQRTGSDLKPKEIHKQFYKIHRELLNNNVIDKYMIDRYQGKYRLFYFPSEQFLYNIYNIFSVRRKDQNKELSTSEKQNLFKFINQLDPSDEVREEIGLVNAKKMINH